MKFQTEYQAFRPWRFPTPVGGVRPVPTSVPNKRRGPVQ